MPQTLLTETRQLAWALLNSYGKDPQAIFQDLHIDLASVNDITSRTNWPTQVALWQRVSASVDDPCFGLRAGSLWHPSHMHALGYAWLSSSTLRSALRRLSRYIKIVNPNLSVGLTEDSRILSVQITRSANIMRDQNWYGDADMSILIAMCRANFGDKLNPISVSFKHPDPHCPEDFLALFCCPVNFDADENSMQFSRHEMDKPLRDPNKLMSQLHNQEMLRYLAQLGEHDIVDQVKNAIIRLLPDGNMSDSKVAETLSMSNRSLQRRLNSQNTTFKTIVTEVREEFALHYIQDRQLTLTEISFMLGYSELSAFSRAFKHWTGTSPKARRYMADNPS